MNEQITLNVEQLRAMIQEAAEAGARQALAEMAKAEEDLVQSAEKTAARLDQDWLEQIEDMAREVVVPRESLRFSINGYTVELIGGQENQVPAAYAAAYRQWEREQTRIAELERAMGQRARELALLGG